MIRLDIWAEARRLRRAEGLPIREIARQLGLARNTVRNALRSEAPPSLIRSPRGARVDAVESQIRALLGSYPRMPATVIAERIGWEHSLTVLEDRVRQIRPEYTGVDPADRLSFAPGELAQCDLWFRDALIPVGFGQERILPVLVMTQGFSRRHDAVMLPSRQAGDLLSGRWELIDRVGRVPRTLLWDQESAIGGKGKLTDTAAGFAGTLGIRIKLAPPRDPETKGRVERGNGYFETSFLPGRVWRTSTPSSPDGCCPERMTGWCGRYTHALLTCSSRTGKRCSTSHRCHPQSGSRIGSGGPGTTTSVSMGTTTPWTRPSSAGSWTVSRPRPRSSSGAIGSPRADTPGVGDPPDHHRPRARPYCRQASWPLPSPAAPRTGPSASRRSPSPTPSPQRLRHPLRCRVRQPRP